MQNEMIDAAKEVLDRMTKPAVIRVLMCQLDLMEKKSAAGEGFSNSEVAELWALRDVKEIIGGGENGCGILESD